MYYTNIVRGAFLKGVGLEVLWIDVLALALYAAVLRTVGYRLFTKRPKSSSPCWDPVRNEPSSGGVVCSS
jgi:hypothetical protein